MKNIILLSDGTGNSAGKLFKTNVWRLYQALDLSEPGSNENKTDDVAKAFDDQALDLSEPGSNPRVKQIAYFDDGVGTASFKPLALFGGAFGWGTKRNVLDLYTFLCRHYEKDDRIYGFGFSRGAFTIRVLTALIASQGVVKAKSESERRHLALQAFREYREGQPRKANLLTPLIWFFRGLRKMFFGIWYKLARKKSYHRDNNTRNLKVSFLGLWDTVAAYGLPIDELTRAWNFLFPLSFPDRKLSDVVDCAYHALAIDDERLSFHPELWNENAEDYREQRALGDRLTQVWFAGMHSNVGGGYPDDGLSAIPLTWIMDKAKQTGLVFLPNEIQRHKEAASINGKMYDSRQGLGGAYRYLPRKIKDLTHDDLGANTQVIIDVPKIHESALIRIKNRVDDYAPIGLPEKYDVVTLNGKILPSPETPQQAADRVNRQKQVWNVVWWKRVVYYITVFMFLLLSAFPFCYPATDSYDGPLYVLSALIGKLGALLPDYLSKWFNAYQSYPGRFALIVGAFIWVLAIGSRLQAKIFDQMRAIFDNPAVGGVAETRPTHFLYRLRSNPTVTGSVKFLTEKLIPFVLTLIILMFILRGLFAILDRSGLVYPARAAHTASTAGISFQSDDFCLNTGVRVTAGKRYRITMTVGRAEPNAWADSSIRGFPVGGFDKWYLTPFIPLRRHIAEPWFKPIARIGKYGNDEYPLNAVEVSSNGDTLTAEIQARRSGDLFVFVNDAVLPVPSALQFFYFNNYGTAEVTVTCVE